MADKKISELPLLNSVSGSSIIVPIVHDGTTVKLNLSQLGQYASQWSAKTGSANTFTGNQTINGNLSVSGKITVNELVAVYETASVVFSSGSNIFGDAPNDIHQFTGSVDVNGTFLLNGSAIGLGQINAFTQSVESQLSKVYNATSSLEQFTSSQDGRNFVISQYTASTDAHIVGISAFTSSQLAVNTGLASVTASINSFTSSQLAVNTGLASVSASLNNFTASQDTRNFVISQFTASTNNHIVGISDFTSSQLAVNLGNSIYTSSVDNHIVGISAFTSSQLAVNLGISSVTGSLIGITNALMGFTASLDNTFATDAQLYQLYQATRSIELHSGSMVGITNGLMAYTSSNETWKTGVRGEISAIEAWTASLDNTYATDAQLYQLYQATRSLELLSGSLVGITNGLMAFTAALDSTYATDAQLYQLYAATASLNTTTGSLKGELAGIEAYTASLKAAAIVSSSTQITNYYKFAETASANTFYGNQTFNNDVRANKFVFTDGVVSQNVGGQNIIGTSGNILYLYTGTSGLYINNQANNAQNVTISDAGVVQTRGKLTVGAPGNDQDIAFGGSNSKLDWAGTGAQIFYSVGALQFSSVGSTNNMILQQNGGALFNAGITGSLMATNGVISGSAQLIPTFVQNSLTSSMTVGSAVSSSYPFIKTGTSILTFNTTNSNVNDSFLVGSNAGFQATGSWTLVAIGPGAGYQSYANQDVVAIGNNAGYQAKEVRNSVFIGDSAGYQAGNQSSTQYGKVFIGLSAGYGSQAENAQYIGYNAGISSNANESNFIGLLAGNNATHASGSNFLGSAVGQYQTSSAYSNFIGYNVANNNFGDKSKHLGRNNIIIGTSLTLPTGTKDSINIGGVLFGTNTYFPSDVYAAPFSGSIGGRIGINKVNPQFTLDVSGSVGITGSLLVTGSLTISSGSITMPNRPAFRVVGTASTDRTGVYTLSGSNFTIDYNEGNHFNITNGKFTAPIAGLYQVYLNARCGSVNAQQQIIIYKNGPTGTTQLMWEAPGNTGVAHFGVSGVIKLAAGDTLEATVSVGSIQFDGNDSWGVTYIG